MSAESALKSLTEEQAAEIRSKHSDEYIIHYYKKALSHENSGKMKGDFQYYYYKLLLQDKAKFYEKAERKKEILAQKTEQKRRANLRLKKRLSEVKKREDASDEGFKRGKEEFRKLDEIEQNRYIKRIQKQNPDKSFNECRDLAVKSFYTGR